MTTTLFALPLGRSTLAIDLIEYFDLEINVQICQRTASGWNNSEFENNFPFKKFPALLETNDNPDDENVFTLHEVTAILVYLIKLTIKKKKNNQKKTAIELLGGNSDNDIISTCDVIRWLSFVSSEIIPVVVIPLRIKLGLVSYDEAKLNLGLDTANALLVEAVEPILKKQRFINNNIYPCIADFFFMIPVSFLASASWNDNWKTEHKEIVEWSKKVIAHDLVAARYKDLQL